MSLWRLWWLTILVPALLAGAFDYVRRRVAPDFLYLWPDPVNFTAVVLLSALVMAVIVTIYVQREAGLVNIAREFASLWATEQGNGGHVDPTAVAQRVLPQIVRWLRLDAGAVLLTEGDRDLMVASYGITEGDVEQLLHLSEASASKDGEYTWRKATAGFHRTALVPLHSGASRYGYLLLATHHKPPPPATDVDVLTLVGQQLGGLLENARLSQRVHHLAALEERDRLSREIHDSLAQDLGYLNVKLESLRGMEMTATLQRELNEMLEMVRGVYVDAREWVSDLRDSGHGELSLGAFLKRTTENFSRRSGIATSLEIKGTSPPGFTPDVEIQLIRVVQEALANVRKHSRASKALLVLEQDGDTARVVVEDNGVGFFVSQAFQDGHYGLQTMRERVEGVGGVLTISSYPGMGSRVEALLPTKRMEVNRGTH